jgi:excinuclease ABC subunit C
MPDDLKKISGHSYGRLLTLQEKLKLLPSDPGVYQMLDEAGAILYVGKAKVLKNRVKSYFQNKDLDPKTRLLVSKIKDFKIITVATELEALILENQLIKRHRPPYNIVFRDDKTYPYLKITFNEEYPRVLVVRKKEEDGAHYFGPYLSGASIYRAMEWVRELFPYRICGNPMPKQACLEYHIKKCGAPCVGLISQNDYGHNMQQIESFLKGEYDHLGKDFEAKMREAASLKQYERAALYRDQIFKLDKLLARQNIVTHGDVHNVDVFELSLAGEVGMVFVLQVRDGKIFGEESIPVVTTQMSEPAEILEHAFLQYYEKATNFPEKVIFSKLKINLKILRGWFETTHNENDRKIVLRFARGEDELSLIRMAKRNAVVSAERERAQFEKKGNRKGALLELQSLLKMKTLPLVIEGFDISHSQGLETVASMVFFRKGFPDKSQYRKFIIKTEQNDDFKSMHEVVTRRYKRLLAEKKPLPDVILIDGGKGQLNAAQQALIDVGLLGKVKLMSLAKQEEEIFLPLQPHSIKLMETSQLLKLLQHVRDESHRFAITFHKQRRKKREGY